MLNLCVKNCVSAHGRHFFLFKQSFCYQINLVIEKCRMQKPKIIAIFIFCKGSSDRRKDAPENDNEDEDSGAMPASSPSSSDIIPPSPPTQ